MHIYPPTMQNNQENQIKRRHNSSEIWGCAKGREGLQEPGVPQHVLLSYLVKSPTADLTKTPRIHGKPEEP